MNKNSVNSTKKKMVKDKFFFNAFVNEVLEPLSELLQLEPFSFVKSIY